MNNIKIDKSSSIPLHVQITKYFKEALRSGSLKPHDRLPNEEDLSKQLHVSRPVVRQAYRALMDEHLIFRYKGRGSFVAEPQIEFNLFQTVNSLTKQIRALGLNIYIQELGLRRLKYDPQRMADLELTSDDEVYELKRIYYGDRKALFYMEMWIPTKYFPEFDEKSFQEEPFMNIVKRDYSVTYDKSQRTFKAIILSNQVCDYLALPSGSAGFVMENVTWDTQGTIVELSHTYMAGLNSKVVIDFTKQL
jgi:GntR family transcriptional regulator